MPESGTILSGGGTVVMLLKRGGTKALTGRMALDGGVESRGQRAETGERGTATGVHLAARVPI
jgi:hypothetical protein